MVAKWGGARPTPQETSTVTYNEIKRHARRLAKFHNEGLDPFAKREAQPLPVPTESRLIRFARSAEGSRARRNPAPRRAK